VRLNNSMRLLLLIGLMILSISAQAQSSAPKEKGAALSPQEIFGRVSPSVFVVEVLDSEGRVLALGSGVVVNLPTTSPLRVAGSSGACIGESGCSIKSICANTSSPVQNSAK